MTAARAASNLLRDTAELPGEPGELLTTLGRYRHALHDLLRSDPNGAVALKAASAEDQR